jgi:hypothetical protein
MKTIALVGFVLLLPTFAAVASPCSGHVVVPQNATASDRVVVQLQGVSDYLQTGGVSRNGSTIIIDIDVPGIPPIPDHVYGCHDVVTDLGYLEAGSYAVAWRQIPLPEARTMRTSGVGGGQPPPFNFPTFASATFVVSAAVAGPVPAIDARGLVLLAVLLALAAAAVMR